MRTRVSHIKHFSAVYSDVFGVEHIRIRLSLRAMVIILCEWLPFKEHLRMNFRSQMCRDSTKVSLNVSVDRKTRVLATLRNMQCILFMILMIRGWPSGERSRTACGFSFIHRSCTVWISHRLSSRNAVNRPSRTLSVSGLFSFQTFKVAYRSGRQLHLIDAHSSARDLILIQNTQTALWSVPLIWNLFLNL